MSNSNLQQLHVLCLQMYQEGKTPTVGILRSKAPFKVSVTEAIEAIKRFNAHKPQLDATGKEAQSAQSTSLNTHRPNSLQTRVETLEKEVAELKQALLKLMNAQ